MITVYGLLHEHQAIRQNVVQITNAINEPEAKFLQKTGNWSDELFRAITSVYKNMQQAIANINDGLWQHFEREEKSLSPLIGNLLTRALTKEHSELLGKFAKVRILANERDLEKLSRQELLARTYEIKNAAVTIFDQIEYHVNKEDFILQMLRTTIMAEMNP